MTRVLSSLLSGARPGFIPQGMAGRRRQMPSGLKDSWAKCAAKKDPSALRISFARLHWRNADEHWRSRKHLRSSLLKKKISAAIGGTLSADCSRLFPPCYSFGCNGQEIEEKKIDEEEIRSSKIEGSEVCEGCQAGSCGGNGSQARSGNPRETG